MKITSVSGVDRIENVKCFKPISKVFVKIIYPTPPDNVWAESDPDIRIRLVDGANGSSKEIVPEMKLSILSEIASKYEGFQRKPAVSVTDDRYLSGFSLSSVIIGGQVDDTTISAVDLSNDKYLDIDLRGLNEQCTYEVWGFESHIISPFVRTYQKFYLSQGEIEKRFSTGENEILVYPIDDIKELQMYARNSNASPVFRREELILDEDGRNDLVYVGLDDKNKCIVPVNDSLGVVPAIELPVRFGYSKWGVMSLVDFSAFEIRREDGLQALTFLMIDTVPSVIVTPSV